MKIQQFSPSTYSYAPPNVGRKSINDGHSIDHNYIQNIPNGGSPAHMREQPQNFRHNHYHPEGYHPQQQVRHQQHHENHNAHIKMSKSQYGISQHYRNGEASGQSYYQQASYGQGVQPQVIKEPYLNTNAQQTYHHAQPQIPIQPQSSPHSFSHTGQSPQSYLTMQSPRNHAARIGQPMAMRGNNNYNGGVKPINEQINSKKRSYNNMIAVQPQYESNNGQNHIHEQQMINNHNHLHLENNGNQYVYQDEQNEPEDSSQTQSLDQKDDEDFDDFGTPPVNELSSLIEQQSPQVRSGQRNELEQVEQQDNGQQAFNMDHLTKNQRNDEVTNTTNQQPQRNKKSVQKIQMSPQTKEATLDKETTNFNKNGGKKQSKSKYSPPSRIKDNRTQMKESSSKIIITKRSQTGLKKLKTEQQLFNHQRKSHSSDIENQSRKSIDQTSQKNNGIIDSDSNVSVDNTIQEEQLKRKIYPKGYPSTIQKIESDASPKKKGGIKQATTNPSGLVHSKSYKSKSNGRGIDLQGANKSPTNDEMEEQQKDRVNSNNSENEGSQSGDEQKNIQQKDQAKIFKVASNNTHSRSKNQRYNKIEDKPNQVTDALINGGTQKSNQLIDQGQVKSKRILNKQPNISKKLPEQSDNSGNQDKLTQKKPSKPAAPASISLTPNYQDQRKQHIDDREKYFSKKEGPNPKPNLNTQQKINDNLPVSNEILKSDQSQSSDNDSQERKDNSQNKPGGRQSERQKNQRKGRKNPTRNVQSDQSDESSGQSNMNKQRPKRGGGQHPKVLANFQNRSGRVLTNSSARAAYQENNQQLQNNRTRMTRQQTKGTPSPQSNSNQNGRSPQSAKGYGSTIGRSPQETKSYPKNLVKTRQKMSQAQKPQQDKSKKSQVLKKSDRDIQRILKLYFEYVCSEMIPSRKIAEIQLGKQLSKVTYEQQKLIELKVMNICFNQYTQRQDKEMRALSSQRSNSLSKVNPINRNSNIRQKANESKSYGKNFGIGDIIDLTQQKRKDKANLYLIYEILVSLDFNDGQNKTDKVDDELPDIEIKFKVHPIIQNYTQESFKESYDAEEYIKNHIDDEYCMDKNSLVCLFEIGGRKENDSRLEFENFVMNFQQVQKSYKLIPKDCDQFQSKVRMCRHQNTLANSTNYEKAYLIEYGYKYEDPTKIYVYNPINPPPIKTQYSNEKGSKQNQFKSNSRSNGKKSQKQLEDFQNLGKLNIVPYNKKKDTSSSASKISLKSKVKEYQDNDTQNSQEQQYQQQQLQITPKIADNQRYKSPIQSKRVQQRSQRSLEGKENQQQPKREGLRTRNQTQDLSSNNSPSGKNQSISSQVKRIQGKDDKKPRNMNDMVEDLDAGVAHKPRQIISRSNTRRAQKVPNIVDKEKQNSRTKRYLNRDLAQNQIPMKVNSKANSRSRQNNKVIQEQEQSRTISEENNDQSDQENIAKTNEKSNQKKQGLVTKHGQDLEQYDENEMEKSSQNNSVMKDESRRNVIEQKSSNSRQQQQKTLNSNSDSDNNMEVDEIVGNALESSDNAQNLIDTQVNEREDYTDVNNIKQSKHQSTTFLNRKSRKVPSRLKNRANQDNNHSTIIAINKKCQEFGVCSKVNSIGQNGGEESSHANGHVIFEDNKPLIQSQVIIDKKSAISSQIQQNFNDNQSSNSSDVGIKRGGRQRRRATANAISTIKEDKNENDSNESMKVESYHARKSLRDRTKSRNKDKYSSDENNDKISVNDDDSSENCQVTRRNNKRSRTTNPKTKVEISIKNRQTGKNSMIENNISTKNQTSTSQMTTRRRNTKRAANKSCSSDEKSNQESSGDFDVEDDVSQILMPNGNSKREKNEFANEYDESCFKLQLSAIPSSLPCREAEQKQITDYLTQGIQNKGSSSSLYISGMPGTGKTATTLDVIKKLLKKQQGKGNHPRFEFIHINAMSLNNPNLVYTILAEKIIGRRLNPQSAALFLDEFFKKKDKLSVVQKHMSDKRGKNRNQNQAQQIANKIRVLLVDELDALITSKQTLLYNLFEWPCNQNSRLLVISIANTMNLPERLQQKIQSRIGQNRLVYRPYNKFQIQTILESRLKGINVVDQKSIAVISQKVAQYSGDMRRSLQITKRAVEICRDLYFEKSKKMSTHKFKQEQLKQVDLDHVIAAFEESSNSSLVKVMRGLRKFEVLVLISLYLEQKQENVSLELVQERCYTIISAMIEYEGKKKAAMSKNQMFSRMLDSGDQDVENEILPKDDRELVEYQNWKVCQMTTSMFREIVKRLQAFGLINLTVEPAKLTDNAFVSHFNFFDITDLRNAFYNNEIYKVQQNYIVNSQKF